MPQVGGTEMSFEGEDFDKWISGKGEKGEESYLSKRKNKAKACRQV